jgi:hypothetical protein
MKKMNDNRAPLWSCFSGIAQPGVTEPEGAAEQDRGAPVWLDLSLTTLISAWNH